MFNGNLCGFEFCDGDPTTLPLPHIDCDIPFTELQTALKIDNHNAMFCAMRLLWLHINGQRVPFRDTGIERHFRAEQSA